MKKRQLRETPLTVAELLTRIRSAVGRGVKYKMGSGSLDPLSALPAGADKACDCSCFVCWGMKISKFTKTDPLYLRVKGGWRNTDAMVVDAGHAQGNLTKIPHAKVGCLLLYGAGWGGASVGHVGFVTEIESPPGKLAVAKKVIHCSKGNYVQTGDAIRETGPEAFTKRNAIYVWPDFLVAA